MGKVLIVIVSVAAYCHAGQPPAVPSDAAEVSAVETRHFLDMICPGNASAAGCLVCPAEMPSSAQTWDLRTITFGHFLRPSSEDALVSGIGCEPHSNGTSGAYLFTRESGAWRKVWYGAGWNADDCKKLTGSDERDLLVCEGSDMHQGVADWFVYLLDVGEDPSRGEDNGLDVFFGLNDSLGSCTRLPEGNAVSGAIESVSFTPAAAPHAVRIVVTARLGEAAIPQKILDRCNESDARIVPTIRTVLRRYEFLFDGRKVVPDEKNPPMQRTWAVPPRTAIRAAK